MAIIILRTWLVSLGCLFLSSLTYAQDLYIAFDPNKMNRMEYSLAANASSETLTPQYVSYAIMDGADLFFLEVGAEGKKMQAQKPKNTQSVSAQSWSKEMLDAINSDRRQVYIVYPKAGAYLVSPVGMAYAQYHVGNSIRFVGSDYDFTVDPADITTGVNYGVPASDTEVYFQSKSRAHCLEELHFKKVSKTACKPVYDLFWTPKIGFTTEKAGATVAESAENTIIIATINEVPADKYISAVCQNSRIMAAVKPAQKVEAPAVTATSDKNLDAAPKRCSEPLLTNQHLVQPGETLFEIARKYALTVGQLKQWNQLPSQKIMACSYLKVMPPNKVAMKPTKPKPKPKPTIATKDQTVLKKAISKPTYDAQGHHIVQKGETLYSVARYYGFTSERFASMNNINTEDKLQVGDLLKTSDCNCDTEGKPRYTSSEGSMISTTEVAAHVIGDNKNTSKIMSDAYEETVVQSKGKVSNPAERQKYVHTVQEGETAYMICDRFNMTDYQFRELNQLDANEVIIPGQTVWVWK